MGADLYIRAVFEPLQQKYRPLFERAVRKRDALALDSKEMEAARSEVHKYYDLMFSEGCFFDTYDATCVLNTLGLSWWSDAAPLRDKKWELNGENLKAFREMVANATQQLPSRADFLERRVPFKINGEGDIEVWRHYFVERRAMLLAFLDKAIELNTSVYCSL